MSEYARAGFAGRFRTRLSDIQCPRIDPCGYRCEAGRGDHEGPHLFEEHAALPVPTPAETLTNDDLARAYERGRYDAAETRRLTR